MNFMSFIPINNDEVDIVHQRGVPTSVGNIIKTTKPNSRPHI